MQDGVARGTKASAKQTNLKNEKGVNSKAKTVTAFTVDIFCC
jgi:hypothetical protein